MAVAKERDLMATALETVKDYSGSDYKYGFVTEIEAEMAAKGLDEQTVRFISGKKKEPEWMVEWRLQALKRFFAMEEPDWAKVDYPPIDFQEIIYYAARRPRRAVHRSGSARARSLPAHAGALL
jgi:Fe-S cluster assembly protein SufB